MGTAASETAGKFSGQDWKSLGENAMKGLAKGIKDNVWRIKDEMKTAAEAAVKAAKDALKVSSPSKVMKNQVGRWIPAGIAEGIRQYSGSIDGAMQDIANDLAGTRLDSALIAQAGSLGAAGGGRGSAQPAGFTQNITINSPDALSPSEVARRTRIETQNMVLALRGA